MLLDEVLPRYEFSQEHSTLVDARPAQVFAAIKQVTAAEIPMLRPLFAVRTLPRRLSSGGANGGPGDRPILDQMVRHGFTLLGEEPEQELAVGVIQQFWKVRSSPVTVADAEEFMRFDDAEYGKAAMSFSLHPTEDGATRLHTETRIQVSDARARRKFAVYWRVVHPGSAVIRRTWLYAIKRRAERRPAPA